ncbi:MAG: YsnF/AvaK domain-containing protein, partial [Janthinobacterium lividum]
MSMETIVAVFDTAAHAAAAVQDLESAGVPSNAITQHSASTNAGSTTTTAPAPEKGFWASLFGAEPEQGSDIAVYDRSMQSGSTIVSVKAPEQSLTQVMEILERHNPVNIDERAATYASTETSSVQSGAMLTGAASTQQTSAAQVTGTTGPSVMADKATGGTIQLAEESLAVGKRALNTGTTRVRRYVIETPVEEQVTLHSEKVVVERRPVTGQVAGTVDFTDKVLEATETDEQAVVSKTARIVEEVGLRKEASDRTETVRDT